MTESAAADLKNLSLNGEPAKDENDNFMDLWKDLKEEDCIRGSTPVDIEKRCLSLCQTYIGGSWNNAKTVQDIQVTRIAGGLTNQLYRARLPVSVPRVEYNPIYPQEEPLDVAIKLYMPKHFKSFHEDDAERLNDILVLTITSQEGIGPKVFGVFADGMIQAYHENESFSLKYQQPDRLRQLAHLLARVHHLNVPIRKNHDWIYNQLEFLLKSAYAERNAGQLIQEQNMELLKSRDPRQEFQELYKRIRALNPPFVFCHNDFRGANILVTKPDERILLVDLEYSAYGYRGHDLASYLFEWGAEPFEFDKHDIPADDVIEMFVRLYVEGCDRLIPGYSKRPENSIQKIVNEVKLASLGHYLFFTAFIMNSTESLIPAVPFDPVGNIKFCEGAYKKYFQLKERFTLDGTIARQ